MTSDRLGPLLKLTEDNVQEFIDYAREPETSIAVMGYCVNMNSELTAQRAAVAERDDQISALRRDSELRADEHRAYLLAAGDEYSKVLRDRDALAATVARVQALREEIYVERIDIIKQAQKNDRQGGDEHGDELREYARALSQQIVRLDAALKGDPQ